MYKRQAVSSIQVILELLVPIAAVFGIYQLFNEKIAFQERQKKFLISLGVFGGLCLIFWLIGGSLFNFKSPNDVQLAIEQPMIFDAIKEDRITIMKSDSLRSLIFILLIGGVLWFALKKKISENLMLVGVGLLIVIDLVGVDRRSVDSDSFISKREYKSRFQATAVDTEILKDKSYYRVLDQARGFMDSHTNNFFNTIGGYSVVRPRKIDDIYNNYIAVKNPNIEVINMLNVKYVIQQNEKRQLDVQKNPAANGPAWFVEEIEFVDDHKAEFKSLSTIDTKKTAVVRNEFKSELEGYSLVKDSISTISVSKTNPDHLAYNVYADTPGFLVFSETYYENGWKAYIDGKEEKIYPVDYMIRGLKVPKGKHTIEFKFEPQVVKTGSTITLASSVTFCLLFFGALFFEFRKRKTTDSENNS